jgi:hypothetical protein
MEARQDKSCQWDEIGVSQLAGEWSMRVTPRIMMLACPGWR